MAKFISLSLAVLLLLAASPAQASNIEAYREEAKQLETERNGLKEQIQEAERKEKVELHEKYSELSALQKAYEKAVEYVEGERAKVASYGSATGLLDKGVPGQFIPIYQAAGEKYGVDWFVLASIHKIETQFSSLSSMVSYAGAIGHMQFMPGTWASYGVDGNGDGKADPWTLEDAVYSAANYLAASGAPENMEKAVFAYNHADWYVEEVLSVASTYKEAYTLNSGTPVADVGKRFINNSVYIFGGGRNQQDISQGYFDCSSFVHWAFLQVGQELGPLTSVSTETLKHLGQAVSLEDAQPGDLVFFDTYKPDGHVGIYMGDGLFIGAQSTTGVAVADMSKGYWKEQFNGRVKRL